MRLYRCIAADPPWEERGGGKSKRGADRHYALLKTPAIARAMLDAPVWRPDPKGCHLWLWATSNHLLDALSVMEILGFRYVSSAVWVKMARETTVDESVKLIRPGSKPEKRSTRLLGADYVAQEALQLGLGQYMRHAHEWLLFGTMGQAMVPKPESRPPSVIIAPRTTTHSEKPDEAFEIMKLISPGPRLEMFARNTRTDWDAWGNELPIDEDPKRGQAGVDLSSRA